MSETTEKPVALVTGGGRSIGRAISKRLAADGFVVVVNYRVSSEHAAVTCAAIKEAGGEAWHCQADVSEATAVTDLFRAIREKHGRLDVLINNVGATHQGLLVMTPEACFRDMFEKNVLTTVLCSKAAIPMMLQKRTGNIVNLSSTATRGAVGLTAYAAAKAAVDALTRGMARELAKTGIRVNAIAPSWVETDMLRVATPASVVEFKKRNVSGRLATPEEVAAAVATIVRPEMSYLSGQVIQLDGGGTA